MNNTKPASILDTLRKNNETLQDKVKTLQSNNTFRVNYLERYGLDEWRFSTSNEPGKKSANAIIRFVLPIDNTMPFVLRYEHTFSYIDFDGKTRFAKVPCRRAHLDEPCPLCDFKNKINWDEWTKDLKYRSKDDPQRRAFIDHNISVINTNPFVYGNIVIEKHTQEDVDITDEVGNVYFFRFNKTLTKKVIDVLHGNLTETEKQTLQISGKKHILKNPYGFEGIDGDEEKNGASFLICATWKSGFSNFDTSNNNFITSTYLPELYNRDRKRWEHECNELRKKAVDASVFLKEDEFMSAEEMMEKFPFLNGKQVHSINNVVPEEVPIDNNAFTAPHAQNNEVQTKTADDFINESSQNEDDAVNAFINDRL